MTGIFISLSIVKHIFSFTNVFFKTSLFPFFISLGLYVIGLLILLEVKIILFTLIPRVCNDVVVIRGY